MAVRQMYRTGLSLVNRKGGGPICGNNNCRMLTTFLFHNNSNNSRTSSTYRGLKNCLWVTSTVSNSRMLATEHKPKTSSKVPTAHMGSILEHHKYKEMKSELSKLNKKNLGPLNTASLYILSSKDLFVNLELLSLDALSPTSHLMPHCKGYDEIKEMKQSGAVQ